MTTTLVKRPFSRTTQVRQYENVSTLDFTEDDEHSGDNWSYKTRKAITISNRHTTFYKPTVPSCRPTNSVKALQRISHSTDLLTSSSSGFFQPYLKSLRLLSTPLVSSLMPMTLFTKEDSILIVKNSHLLKGYIASQLQKEFARNYWKE